MSGSNQNRRHFMKGSLGGLSAVAVFGIQPEFTGRHQAARQLNSDDLVRFERDIQPLVRLIEATPRENCIETVAKEIRNGTTYRTLMAALFLAGISNIKSTNTGGPLHAVFVMHSAHQMSLDSSAAEQFLPMFWALDNFKAVQERGDRLEKMKTFRGKKISPERSIIEFEAAMESFDPDRAEAAMVSMLSNFGRHQVVEHMWKYGARDYRAIGHKAIYLSNGWRTLNTIGWRHSEPAMRHIARALVAYGPNAVGSGFTMDQQSYAGNVVRSEKSIKELPKNWIGDLDDPTVVMEMLAAMRTSDHDVACDLATGLLESGAARSNTIWDAVHLMAGEIVMRQATIRPVHGVTSVNAIRYAFNQSSNPATRLLLLLQAIGWICHFVRYISSLSRAFPEKRIDLLSADADMASSEELVPQIFDEISTKPDAAANKAFALGQQNEDVSAEFLRVARKMIYRKGNESHRYKFPAAALEDVRQISPRWRPNFFAASTYYLCGSKMPDSAIMKQVRNVLSNEQ